MDVASRPVVRGGRGPGPLPGEGQALTEYFIAEAGRLGTALNSMPEGIEEAFRAREASEAKVRRFAADASHELRTPITTIYAASEVLSRQERELPEETRRELYEDIKAESQRLERLVEDLLVLTRFERGAMEIGLEPVLVQRVAPAVVAAEQPRWPETEFVVRVPPHVPTVQGETTYIEQVVRNLVTNAAKYSPPGTCVEVCVEEADGEVQVRVLDQGPGVAPDEAPRLFELFYRSEATAAHVKGAGIGLFVSKQLIEAMGGRIWARPRPDGGAEFGFALRPLAPEFE